MEPLEEEISYVPPSTIAAGRDGRWRFHVELHREYMTHLFQNKVVILRLDSNSRLVVTHENSNHCSWLLGMAQALAIPLIPVIFE